MLRGALELQGGSPTTPTEVSRQLRRRLLLISMTATIGGLLFGYDTGVVNGALLYMGRDLHLTPADEGFITAALLLGAALGALLAGRLADRFGRRHTLWLLAGTFVAGAIACALAPDRSALAGFRFLLGLAVGGASVVVPTYLAELAPPELRGRLVTQNELMIVSGQLLAFAVNAVIAQFWGESHAVWRWMLGIAAAPGIVLGIGAIFLPESPRWLVARGRTVEAEAVLGQLRLPGAAALEARSIATLAGAEAASDIRGWAALRIPWVRAVLLVGIGIGIVQQVTGVNSIMYYGTQILSRSGLGVQGALVANVLNGVVSVLATFLGIALVGRTGRRWMLVTGLIGTTSSLLLLGVVSLLFQPSPALAYLVLGAMSLFLCFQQGFVSPVTWLLLSEIFPLKVRGLGMGAATLVLWGANFVVAFSFPQLVAGFGVSSTFFGFVSVGILAVVFSARYVPETGGRSLEAIEELLQGRYSRGTRT
ncbi:MAG TPA: sugar porter family MFS transporter [Steroidobacteraceae bacterium]|nr:sugar porter family MFS transporter [Steroidobacteraceae bacterium]